MTSRDLELMQTTAQWLCAVSAMATVQQKAQCILWFAEHKIDNLNNVTCLGGKSTSELTVNEICPISTAGVIIIISILLAVLGLIVGLLIALYYRYNQEIKVWLYAHQMFLWLVTEDELDRDKLYDAFISYSHRDEEILR
ncbi:protein toll-like [Lycorma delicatula]|uniref:protein toll-like n=1 Tax=Lycorma delicatula TaxID=130591 RepID=UPI003F518961